MSELNDLQGLARAAAETVKMRSDRELEILAALEVIDPELVRGGLDLWGSREGLAKYLIQTIPTMAGASCYDLLARGQRDRVLELFNAIRYGIYL